MWLLHRGWGAGILPCGCSQRGEAQLGAGAGALCRAMGRLALGCSPGLLLPEREEEGGGGLPWSLDPRGMGREDRDTPSV